MAGIAMAIPGPIRRRRWDILLVGAFFVLCLVLMSRHEMWRDEMQHWKVVTDSSSPADVLASVKYEGHPFLWHALLYPVSRLTASPAAMQAVHLLIATLAALILVRFSPFSVLQKGLFLFGYFPLYEYGVIARNYGLGMLLLFVACALYPQRRTHFVRLACVLALAANTNVYALIIVVALSAGLLWEVLRKGGGYATGQVLLGYGLVLAAAVTAVLVMVPPGDSGNVIKWTLRWDWPLLQKVAATPLLAYLPLPHWGFHFWNTNLLVELGLPTALQLILGSLFLLFGILILRRKAEILVAYLAGTAGLLGFFYLKYYGFLRHHGHLFLLFVICSWLFLGARAGAAGEAGPAGPPRRFRTGTNAVFTAILACQLAAGLAAGGMDAFRTFSQGRIAARFIASHGLDGLPIVGDIDFACTTISGYLNKRIYYPRGRRWGSFVVWDTIRKERVSEALVIDTAWRLGLKRRQACLIILNSPLAEGWFGFTRLRKIGQTRPAVVEDESFFLYLLPYNGGREDFYFHPPLPGGP
jgi:hypothetical protein